MLSESLFVKDWLTLTKNCNQLTPQPRGARLQNHPTSQNCLALKTQTSIPVILIQWFIQYLLSTEIALESCIAAILTTLRKYCIANGSRKQFQKRNPFYTTVYWLYSRLNVSTFSIVTMNNAVELKFMTTLISNF